MFNEYPYTDYHELNTDWIISKIKNVETAEANTKQYAEDADAAKVAAEDAKDIAVQAKEDAEGARDDARDAADDAQHTVDHTLEQIDLLQARVDNIIPDGTQTAGNMELLDIRVGYDGETYASAGDAVRGQVQDLHTDLESMADIAGECTHVWINKYDHSENPSPDYLTTDYIAVKAGQSYFLTGAKQPGNAYDSTLNIYDTSKVFVSYKVDTYNNTEWVPTADGYIRLTNYSATVNPVIETETIYVVQDIDALKTRVSAIENRLDRRLAGKSFIWFGTSIPCGSKASVVIDGVTYKNNYPDMIGTLFGCTVINQAVGTSTARTGEASRVTPDDPMGIKYVQYQMATRCLTQTAAEKQSILDDWATKWGPNGTYHLYGAPTTLTASEQQLILDSTYENLLTPYLDGTYPMPDYFVFDHGYNDGAYYNSTTGYQMSEVPSDPYDRHYYFGALNKLFDMILTVNPKAKILTIGHYTDQDRSWVSDAQEAVADYWEFPLLKVWEISGISDKEILVGGVPTSMIQVYCPDGLHPHSDVTGGTNLMLATKIGNWLCNMV